MLGFALLPYLPMGVSKYTSVIEVKQGEVACIWLGRSPGACFKWIKPNHYYSIDGNIFSNSTWKFKFMKMSHLMLFPNLLSVLCAVWVQGYTIGSYKHWQNFINKTIIPFQSHLSSLSKGMLETQEMCVKEFCGLMRPKWIFLDL